MEQPEYNMFRRDKVEREFAPLYKTRDSARPLVAARLRFADGKIQ